MHTDTQIDPYVLGLAVAAAPCFGYHDAAAASCGDCPVADRCVQARYGRAVLVAAQLLKKSAPKPKVKETRHTTLGSAPAPEAESIDDILDSMSKGMATPAPVQASTPTPVVDVSIDDLFPDLNNAPVAATPFALAIGVAVAPVAAGPKLTQMRAVVDSVCYSCSGKIGKGTDAVFLPGKGLRHVGCP